MGPCGQKSQYVFERIDYEGFLNIIKINFNPIKIHFHGFCRVPRVGAG